MQQVLCSTNLSDKMMKLCSTIHNEEDDDNAISFPRKNRPIPKPSTFGRSHRPILDSSKSEDDDNVISFLMKNRPIPKPSTFGRSHRPILDSSESEDDDNVISFLMKNRPIPKPSTFGRNHRPILDSSESEDDQGQYYGHNNKHLSLQHRNNDISSLLRMLQNKLNPRVGAGAGAGAGRSQLIINKNLRTIPDDSDSCTDDEGLTQHYFGKIKHFSHPHNLSKYDFQQYSQTYCKVCGLQLVGSGYGCQSCQFYVHASCFDLPQKIRHDAHHEHPLTLRYPAYYKHCGKTCDACCESITLSFLYCCDLCDFDLHVTCATLYNVINGSGGKLRLRFTFPFDNSNNNIIPRCNVCNKQVSKEGWLYYSKDTGDVAHINCAKARTLGPSWIKEKLNMLKTN